MYQIIYIGSKWCDSLPDHGLSPTVHNIVASFNASGLGKCQHFSFDEYYFQHKKSGDEALIKLCQEVKPDFIMMDVFNGQAEKGKNGEFTCGRAYTWLNPIIPTFATLKKMKIPMVAVSWDTVWEANIELTRFLLDYINFNVLVDTVLPLYLVDRPDRYIVLWTPQDPNLYYDAGEENRDIPISFIGRYNKPILISGGTTGRPQTINFLRSRGIDIFHSGGQREKTSVSVEEYASFIRRSKIGLNLPKSHSGLSQITGRTFEILLSGSMLLEEINLETLRFLSPMIDYIAFQGSEDLYAKALYFMRNDDARMEIAQNGYKKAVKHYNNIAFWQAVIDKLKEDNAL